MHPIVAVGLGAAIGVSALHKGLPTLARVFGRPSWQLPPVGVGVPQQTKIPWVWVPPFFRQRAVTAVPKPPSDLVRVYSGWQNGIPIDRTYSPETGQVWAQVGNRNWVFVIQTVPGLIVDEAPWPNTRGVATARDTSGRRYVFRMPISEFQLG